MTIFEKLIQQIMALGLTREQAIVMFKEMAEAADEAS